jgi:hypothetical protein
VVFRSKDRSACAAAIYLALDRRDVRASKSYVLFFIIIALEMDISYLLNYASLYQIKRKKNFENLKSLLDINC